VTCSTDEGWGKVFGSDRGSLAMTTTSGSPSTRIAALVGPVAALLLATAAALLLVKAGLEDPETRRM
jgi:hypothetical protein